MNANDDQPAHVRPAGDGTPLIVLHLMKTGGFSLLYHVLANVPRAAAWGIPDEGTDELDAMAQYSSVERLRALDVATRSRLEVVMGHLPFAVVDVAGFESATVATVVRDPVARVISYLAMCQAMTRTHRDQPLEAIYEDENLADRMILNHQTKMLGMTAEQATSPPPRPQDDLHPEFVAALIAAGAFDEPQFDDELERSRFSTDLIDTPLVWPVAVDESTLAGAKRNLERVDLLGIHEDYDGFLQRLAARQGWTIDPTIRVNQGAPIEIADSFRRRIEEGNALDLELYEHARSLLARG